jgi:phospholipid transport system substrate-binding protein
MAMVGSRVVAMLFGLLMLPGVSNAAPSARAEIETFFERAGRILEDATDVTGARAEFRTLSHPLFDGRAAARQALGGEWDRRTSAEREQFTRAFSDVFERAYLEIVQGQLPRHRAPDVAVIGEDVVDPPQTVGRPRVRAKDGSDVRMDYAMTRTGDRWRVHDIVIDGVSLVDNYRAQFARVLRTESYADLLERLRDAAGPQALAVEKREAPVETVVYFGAGRADLSADARRKLEKIAPRLADEHGRVVVEGHADGRGDARSNEALAERRAIAIRRQLVAGGIDADRIEVVTVGDRRPVCRDQGEQCWALNRRAWVRLVP